jgi:hypothetical protein
MVEMSRRGGAPAEFNGKQHICTYRRTVLVFPLSQCTTSIRVCQRSCCITYGPQTKAIKTFLTGQTSPFNGHSSLSMSYFIFQFPAVKDNTSPLSVPTTRLVKLMDDCRTLWQG